MENRNKKLTKPKAVKRPIGELGKRQEAALAFIGHINKAVNLEDASKLTGMTVGQVRNRMNYYRAHSVKDLRKFPRQGRLQVDFAALNIVAKADAPKLDTLPVVKTPETVPA